MAELLYKCLTKATNAEGDQMRFSVNWALARRGFLKVYEDRLVCGDWTIPHTEITNAVLTSFRSTLFIPGHVLRVDTAERTYHFGLHGSKFWKSDLPFKVSREQGSLGYSTFSIVARVILVAVLVYWLWEKLAGGA
jgi:hypothetical protein